MQRTINIILIILIIIALGVLAYYVTRPEPEPQAGLAPSGFADESGVTASALRNQEFIQLLRDLNKTSIERSFFDSQIFQSLREFGRELTPQPKGRSNPFAAFGIGNIAPIQSQSPANGARQTSQTNKSTSSSIESSIQPAVQ